MTLKSQSLEGVADGAEEPVDELRVTIVLEAITMTEDVEEGALGTKVVLGSMLELRTEIRAELEVEGVLGTLELAGSVEELLLTTKVGLLTADE